MGKFVLLNYSCLHTGIIPAIILCILGAEYFQFIKGFFLEYLIHNGHMNEDEARKKFSQIVKAVEYCHRHNIVHRDLKVILINIIIIS